MTDLKKDVKRDTLNIFNREKVEVVGVVKVLSSTKKEVIAKLDGDFLKIVGNFLNIIKLEPNEKLLIVAGEVSGVEYFDKINKKTFLGKVFK